MYRLLIVLILCSIGWIQITAQESDDTDPLDRIIGESVPEAEAILNENGLLLSPQMRIAPDTDAPHNTIVSYSLNADNTVEVTVARDINVALIWDHRTVFQNFAGLQELGGDELFRFVNLSEDELYLRHLQIAEFDLANWQTTLRAKQCALIWSSINRGAFQPDPCEAIQSANVATETVAEQIFWQGADVIEVSQNGIHRATCEIAEGRCDLWVSPNEIAEDIAAYIYLIYDEQQFALYNNSDSQWMELTTLTIDGKARLEAVSTWDNLDIASRPNVNRLAPNQCLWFTEDASLQPMTGCDPVAIFEVEPEDIFWRDPFTLTDTIRGQNTLACPATQGGQTICSLPR